MKLLKFLLYLALGIVALVCILGLFAKKTFTIERSIEIVAPKSLVYDQVVKYEHFKNWNDWKNLDPEAKITIEGEDGSVGAICRWSGNKALGTGWQKILSQTPDRIEHEIHLEQPLKMDPSAAFVFSGENPVKVTWTFEGKFPFPWNAAAMFTDINRGLGSDYEKGLAALKGVCESEWSKIRRYKDAIKEEIVPARTFAGVRKTVPFAGIGEFFNENLGMLMQKGGASKLTPTSAPSGLYWTYDEQKGQADMAAAVAMSKRADLGPDIQWFDAGGKALVIDYFGPYELTGYAHLAMDHYMEEKGLKNAAPVLEEYITDPGIEKDTAKWLTKVIYFLEPSGK